MDDSGAILCQISILKDMLDQVNEEIEANYESTREIESEIVKCCELEMTMVVSELELTKSLYLVHFKTDGLRTVAADSRASMKCLEDEISSLGVKRDEILNSVNNKRLSINYIRALHLEIESEKLENEKC